jgi:multimeric flavodoxin WrbA
MSLFLSDESLFSNITNTISYINNPDNNFKNITFITTSNRWKGDTINVPKSSIIAKLIKRYSNKNININIIDASSLNIHVCEGNVSSNKGNVCGVKDALMKDKKKDPHNIHRCWASVNNEDDELYKVVNFLIDSDLVLFFTSVRWGQTNSIYQKLIERLTWLENRHATLGEDNILKNIKSGIIILGHNYNGSTILDTQRQVLRFFGFNVQNSLCWHHQYTHNSLDETPKGYKISNNNFYNDLKIFINKQNGTEEEFNNNYILK